MYCRPEYDMRQIGRNLRRLRERKNLTVEQVREYLCLGTVQAVYKYETGKSYPQTDTMFALMELYDADLYDVIGESNELSPVRFRNTYNSIIQNPLQIGLPYFSLFQRTLYLTLNKLYVGSLSFIYFSCCNRPTIIPGARFISCANRTILLLLNTP